MINNVTLGRGLFNKKCVAQPLQTMTLLIVNIRWRLQMNPYDEIEYDLLDQVEPDEDDTGEELEAEDLEEVLRFCL